MKTKQLLTEGISINFSPSCWDRYLLRPSNRNFFRSIAKVKWDLKKELLQCTILANGQSNSKSFYFMCGLWCVTILTSLFMLLLSMEKHSVCWWKSYPQMILDFITSRYKDCPKLQDNYAWWCTLRHILMISFQIYIFYSPLLIIRSSTALRWNFKFFLKSRNLK